VWMVLQGFSWNELGESDSHKDPAYPTFAETEFMALDSIAHGARGVLYWGSSYTKNAPFRESVYAVTRELAALQPFLVAPEVSDTKVTVVELPFDYPATHVRAIVRKAGADFLIVLINEDDLAHMGVEVEGITGLTGKPLHRLYSTESIPVKDGQFIARLMPREVRIYCTDRKYEVSNRQGRDFAG